MSYDALVIGGGIAGMESAILLGDMGYRVILVEKEPSIGGKMILLSKVFPTLDCASCISTPKMAGTANHPNIELNVYSEVSGIERLESGRFRATVRRKPTYVDPVKCTGCQDCERACTSTVPDQYNFELVSRRAAHIAYPQAVPKKAVIERRGTSPCTYACPAGIRANGYISLLRQGEVEKAFELILRDAPLVGSLGRACYAPCQPECTRTEIGDAPHIRLLKRYIADTYYDAHQTPAYGPPAERHEGRVAVIGSGPAGLSAAFFLARGGYEVVVFEAAPLPGGMLRTGIPPYRLPKEVVDRDILNVTALGVDIRTGVRIESIDELREQGFGAVFVSVGAARGRRLGIEGEDLPGVSSGLELLKTVNLGGRVDLTGKRAVVVGGGNVAIDVARTALRLGASDVTVMYRRTVEEMPASVEELEGARAEGVRFVESLSPLRIRSRDGKVTGIEGARSRSVVDGSGKRSLRVDERRRRTVPADVVFTAIGQESESERFVECGLEANRDGTIRADAGSLMTCMEGVFAGGETVSGPSMIVDAIAYGKRAAFYIDLYLRGEAYSTVPYEDRLPPVDKAEVLARQESFWGEPVEPSSKPAAGRTGGFEEVELPLGEAEALASAANCLNCGICTECMRCVDVCPADAVDLDMRGSETQVEVSSIVVSTGFELFPAELQERFGVGRFPNVISAMQMDRLVAPTRPFDHVLRPGDGKEPSNIAYVLCVGSRDATEGTPICSRVCCMYSIKQAQLILGALPIADVTIYYIDIRAFGKGYEEFFEQTRAMGVRFVKGKVAKIEERPGGDLMVRYEDIDEGGRILEAEHDLVVLSTGFMPNTDYRKFFTGGDLESDEFLYVREPAGLTSPGRTAVEGVFAAGTATGPMDIPDSILHAGAAASQAAAYIEKVRERR
jgi:heterodisulfide reductase subunit A